VSITNWRQRSIDAGAEVRGDKPKAMFDGLLTGCQCPSRRISLKCIIVRKLEKSLQRRAMQMIVTSKSTYYGCFRTLDSTVSPLDYGKVVLTTITHLYDKVCKPVSRKISLSLHSDHTHSGMGLRIRYCIVMIMMPIAPT